MPIILLDSSVNGPSGLVSSWQLPSVVASGDDVLLFAAIENSPNEAISAAGWAVRVQANDAYDGSIRYVLADKLVSTGASPYADTFATGGGTTHWAAFQAAFRATGAVTGNKGAQTAKYNPPAPGATDPVITAVLDSPATAGNVIFGYVSLRTDTGATFSRFDWPFGWIVLEHFAGSPYVGTAEIAYKISDGTEDDLTVTIVSDKVASGVVMAVEYAVATDLTADFSASPRSGDAPLDVTFTDQTTGGQGTVISWLWEFGDGSTSTDQNPLHVFDLGVYNVTLTVTTDLGETDSKTRTTYVTATGEYVSPSPGAAVIEIRAAAIGAARWGVAHWGEDVWSSAGWVDVTPQSIDAVVRWGSHQPEAGVLAETEAASWIVDTYDPDRLLDPGNTDSPYHTDLRAGLPIRVRHRGTIVRQGVCETIAYYHAGKRGGIRVTDNLSLLARTPVPEDTILSDTLRARARDVIAAAGLAVTVEPDPPSGDPALAPRLENERSAWRHIADAAEQTLHVAYIDRIGTLRFRAWASPYDRNRGVDGTNLVDLGVIVQTRGLYSVIQVQQTVGDGGLLIERRLTPTPRYGAVTYKRSDPTPDADDWAAAVLADRSLQTVQWLPGLIYPLTADDVEYFATLEAMERFGVDHATAVPPVDITGIIVGGEFHVTGKKDSAAVWGFQLELAQTAQSPLYTDTDPAEFLLNETGDAYLYAD